MEIKTWRDPYDSGFSPTSPKTISLHSGLTVLVGCNGAGKTTLLRNIAEECRHHKIPYHMFDNLRDGGSTSIGSIFAGWQESPVDNVELGVSLWTASEGEAIKLNVARQSVLYKEFFKTGVFNNKTSRLVKCFQGGNESECTSNVRILLFDATDSGLSIDNICELKSFFQTIIEDANSLGLELYLIMSANEYELCRGEDCFDVNKGEYIKFSDYEAYRKFILQSRKNKEKRINKQQIWREKQYNKELAEFEKHREYANAKKLEIQQKLDSSGQISWEEHDILTDRYLKNFIRQSRFLTEDLLNE